MRVLIVEDEKSLRHMLALAFEARGYQVVAVGDAESALKQYNDKHFPFVVLDWLLPGMSGLDLGRVIRKLPRGDEPFLLLATARTSRNDLDVGLASGIDDYLAKPLDLELLNTRITVAEQVIRQRSQRREAEQRFESVFRQSPDAIALVRQADDVVIDANDSFASLFGVTREEVLDPSNHLVGERLLAQLDLQSGVKRVGETVAFARPPHNTVVHTLTSVESVDVAGEPCWLVMCHDVTERERLRSQLMLADKMSSVGTLAAGVAHEINNPLAYMIANLSFVIDELRGLELHDKDVIEALNEAMHGADRVKNIVRDLKSFSRDDEEQLGPVDVQDVLDSAINLAWNEIRHRARLVKEYEEVPLVCGNKGRLGQVFVNLLINAAQAIAEGDAKKNTIRVKIRSDADGRVVVEVKDTGPGIRPELMRRIFDPFFTTKPVGVGTGLGLSICHAIVTSMGGTIAAESAPGQGASFSVSLASTTSPLPIAASDRAPLTSGKRARILLIDDEAMIGRSIHRALSVEHDIDCVMSARDALDHLARGQHYDLILCDVMMPEMSGMDFYAQVERDHQLALQRVVFVTGGAFTPRAKAFVEQLAAPVLEKPLDLSILRRMILERIEPSVGRPTS